MASNSVDEIESVADLYITPEFLEELLDQVERVDDDGGAREHQALKKSNISNSIENEGIRGRGLFKKLQLGHYNFYILNCWKILKRGCKPCERKLIQLLPPIIQIRGK